MPRIVGLIPLRGRSKRIPCKNIKAIAGKPLAYWVCAAARESCYIDDVYVSTEDPRIRAVVESLHLGVKVIDRPIELAGDKATTDAVILDFGRKVDFDTVVTIQATSPLLSGRDLDTAIDQFGRESCDSLLTGVLVKRFFWTLDGRPLNYDFLHRPFTQVFSGSLMENGSFYITKREVLEQYGNRLGGKIGVYVMPLATGTELDTPEDWREVEELLIRSQTPIREKIERVKIILSDFDGVWTDNRVYTDASGAETLKCSKEDSLGLDRFRDRSAIPLLVVSKEKNEILRRRCEKLGLPVLSSIDHKFGAITQELLRRRFSWSQACYVGNDVNDLECIRTAGLSFCPADARPEIRSQVDYILSHPGGDGAIREMLELLSTDFTDLADRQETEKCCSIGF
jgi:YrbI family 3-deoxy-D-manno-octulosonate 8-phosphate phosphatase